MVQAIRSIPLMRSYHTASGPPPGARFIPEFIPNTQQIVQESLHLYRKLTALAQGKQGEKVSTYLSRQHNLPTNEYYKLIHLTPEQIDAGHFEKYGEKGHTLTYFIGTKNIPDFVRKSLIVPMEKLTEVQTLKHPSLLNWNFTFNTYRTSPQSESLPGFDFHIDIPSNGDITAIFTALSEARLEMKRPEQTAASYGVTLTEGSLFLLSGEARWEWQHRIVPKTLHAQNLGEIERISLVLGCN